MNFSFDDVIIAQSTPSGNGRRGMVRLSGPNVFHLVKDFITLSETSFEKIDFSSPFIRNGDFNLWGWERKIPVVVWFWPAGRGFTGQETVEFHLPGSPPILTATVDRFCREEKIRLARPGEFTLRAFLSGRLDLTQAEAILGVIDAADDSSLETALTQLSGNLGGAFRDLRESLMETLAHLEAGFDFIEEDIEFISRSELAEKIEKAANLMEAKLAQMETRTDLRPHGRLLLTGVPNSGKSSLFNRWMSIHSPTNRAIVSDVAGTTRDYLEAEISLGRHRALLVDTAGIEVNDFSEENATLEDRIQHQSRFASQNADLRLLCVETARLLSRETPTDWEGEEIERMKREGAKPTLVVLTKSDAVDLNRDLLTDAFSLWKISPETTVFTSAQTGEGLAELISKSENLLFGGESHSEVVPETALRCRQSLRTALESLRRGENLIAQRADEVLIALEIRTALDQLGLILGVIQTDDILDRIFSRFCVGK